VMGLGFVTGAIGIPINGALADAVGLQLSLLSQVLVVLATIVIAWFLPSEEQMDRYAVSSSAGPEGPALQPAPHGAGQPGQ